ncbi:E3 ubiquitin-protein ligase CCNB1IP1-like [Heracleum sosnowskyi]|uniref:E3 ubiquitin-protein ligase CCNB1IP1-like n=1 Tax=Heracleum sosnowskyi TaxID=360622 RepID=A0AAD8HHN9_9APIA|nr:E3 ubiquitin-protein ligase CCNB1IP1-like [Heracleum sosnowskyi]
MKCNACWRDLEGKAISTTCGHLLCTEDAGRILSNDAACPICDQMAMAGISPQILMKSAYRSVMFYAGQKELEMQFKMNRIVGQCRQKCEAMQGKFTEKLEQVHTAYQKMAKKCQMMEQEMESLSKDKQELQEKFSEKSRQKRKLDEMYDQLRCEYESIKRTAIQPANSFYSGIEPDLFASTANMMPNRDPFKKDWPAYTPDTPGPREDIWPSVARQNSSNSGAFDVSAGSPVKQSAGPTDFSNRRGINRTAFAAGARSGAAVGAGNPSMMLRNLIISPIKRPQLSQSRPQMFTL